MDEGDEITANYVDRLTVELQGYDITSVDIGWEMNLRTLIKLVEKKLNFFQNG